MSLNKFCPKDWSIQKLSNVADFKNGKGHEKFIDENGNYIVVNSKFISTEGEVKKFSNENLSPLEKDTITLVMSDIPNGKALGKCFYIAENNKYTLNQRICSIKPKRNIEPRFLFFSLNRNKYFLAFDNGVGQTNLKKEEVLSCPIPLPPLPEQQKIADILSTVDEKIAVIDQQITATEELKKGLMHRLLTKGIGHTEFKDSPLGKIPKSWEVKNLEEIADVKGGKRLPKGKSLIETKNSHPYIRVADMKMGGVDTNDILYVPDEVFPSIARYIINKDDLFITVAGTLGLVGEIPEELDGANLTENADKITNIKINKDFLLYVLLSPIIQNAVEKEQTNNAQPKLALTRIRTFKVPIPSKDEQQKISETLKCIFEKIQNQKNKKQAFLHLKKGLMQQMLTGKIRVNNLIEA